MTRTKWNLEDVKKYMEQYEYILLSTEYINCNTKLKVKCPKGHEYEVTFTKFKIGRRCPHCSKTKPYTFEDVKKKIEENGYKLLSTKYVNVFEKLDMECPLGHEFKMTWNNFNNHNQRCSVCARKNQADKQRLTYSEVKEYVESFDYKLLSTEYHTNREKLNVQCEKGHIYNVTFCDFRNGYRCPHCNESKGEKNIRTVLNKFNINYESQYRFEDCKFKYTLPFDFYLIDLKIAIEFDGEQHYKIKNFFGGLDGFISTKIRDTIKNEYCRDNNIKLVRIPYWEFDNIEKIIKHELNKI